MWFGYRSVMTLPLDEYTTDRDGATPSVPTESVLKVLAVSRAAIPMSPTRGSAVAATRRAATAVMTSSRATVPDNAPARLKGICTLTGYAPTSNTSDPTSRCCGLRWLADEIGSHRATFQLHNAEVMQVRCNEAQQCSYSSPQAV